MILNISEKKCSVGMEAKRCIAIAMLGDKWLLHAKHAPTRTGGNTMISKNEMKALQSDAARYRWLRDIGDKTYPPFTRSWSMTKEMVDDRIDKTMVKEKQ